MKRLSIFLLALFSISFVQAQNYNLIIGTYTNKGTSEGIYVYNYNTLTAQTKLKSTTKTINPSYLTVSKDKKFIYCVNEDGGNSMVSAFKFNSQSGGLTYLNRSPAEGADPCYIIVDDQNIILANYSGGNISIFNRDVDGSVGQGKQVVQHKGKSIDPKRQTSAHVHQVQLTPDKKYLISNDLGEDQVYLYKYYPTSISHPLQAEKVIKTNLGSGPRHMAFSPNGKFAYLAHEFNGSITAFTYANGNINKIQEISTVSQHFAGKIDGADIHVSPDGKFLYETNRGDANAISLFSIAGNGKLTFIETVKTLGKGPRNFAIDPSGHHLLIAHQYTNDVIIFNRNQKNGKLTDSGKRINVGSPVCLVFSK